ncbi:MAG: hypothetical protein ACSLE1_15750 [Sphingobium sp.]
MTKPADQALKIISDKGLDLTSEDLREIEFLLTEIDFEDLPDHSGTIFGALALVVNDPLYQGDIAPIE